jgi:hypothetical protein
MRLEVGCGPALAAAWRWSKPTQREVPPTRPGTYHSNRGVGLGGRIPSKPSHDAQPPPATLLSRACAGRDSNRRPSDYESDRIPPPGPAQTHPGCSGAGPISSRPVLCRLVAAPGLPQRLPAACIGVDFLAWLAAVSIRSQSDGKASELGAGAEVAAAAWHLVHCLVSARR